MAMTAMTKRNDFAKERGKRTRSGKKAMNMVFNDADNKKYDNSCMVTAITIMMN